MITNHLPSWWFQPIWKLDHFPRVRGENKKIFETTTQIKIQSQIYKRTCSELESPVLKLKTTTFGNKREVDFGHYILVINRMILQVAIDPFTNRSQSDLEDSLLESPADQRRSPGRHMDVPVVPGVAFWVIGYVFFLGVDGWKLLVVARIGTYCNQDMYLKSASLYLHMWPHLVSVTVASEGI